MKFIRVLGVAVLLGTSAVSSVWAQAEKLGAGAFHLSPKNGDKPPPIAPYRTQAMLNLAAPTNQW